MSTEPDNPILLPHGSQPTAGSIIFTKILDWGESNKTLIWNVQFIHREIRNREYFQDQSSSISLLLMASWRVICRTFPTNNLKHSNCSMFAPSVFFFTAAQLYFFLYEPIFDKRLSISNNWKNVIVYIYIHFRLEASRC